MEIDNPPCPPFVKSVRLATEGGKGGFEFAPNKWGRYLIGYWYLVIGISALQIISIAFKANSLAFE